MLEYTLKQADPGLLMVKLVGEVKSCEDINSLRQTIAQSQDQGQTHLILDFGEVRYIDSSGLGFLAMLKGMFQERGGAVAILNPSDVVRRALEFTCIDQLVPLFVSMGEAKKFLREAKVEPRITGGASEKAPEKPKEEKRPAAPKEKEQAAEPKEAAAT